MTLKYKLCSTFPPSLPLLQVLNNTYFARLKACKELEDATAKLIRQAVLERRRRENIWAKEQAEIHEHERVLAFPGSTRGSTPNPYVNGTEPRSDTPVSLARMVPDILSSKSHISTDLEQNDSPISQYASEKALLDELVPPSKRPSERRGLLGLWGLRLDKFDTLRVGLRRVFFFVLSSL